MAVTTQFVLPELNAARDTWATVTGLDTSSPEWGEVMAVMDDCGLLSADQLPSPTLFDGEDAAPPPEHTAAVLRTRLALAGSAYLVRRSERTLAPATAVEIMAVLLDQVYAGTEKWDPEYAEMRLGADVADRLVGLVDSPSEALRYLRDREHRWTVREPDVTDPLSWLVLDKAYDSDGVALAVFADLDRIAAHGYQAAIAQLCDGRWVMYRTGL